MKRDFFECKQCEANCIISAVQDEDGNSWDTPYLAGQLCSCSQWRKYESTCDDVKNTHKVYCEECEHYAPGWEDDVIFTDEMCYHKNNRKKMSEGTYAQRPRDLKTEELQKSPEQINKNNDCPWFQKRRDK